MRPATLRRFLVFGVCAFGVGCLYLVPSVARSPDGISSRRPDDQPISRPSPTVKAVAVRSTGQVAPDIEGHRPPAEEPTATTTANITQSHIDSERDESSQREKDSESGFASSEDGTAAAQAEPTPRRQPSGATAFDPQQKKSDDAPPDPVRGIRFGPITPDDLTVRWSASADDTGVVGYQVWLDGFRVAITTDTQVTVSWFNDDIGQHVVQVKALDAAGNLSRTTEIVLVSRPSPEPSATASPRPSPEPSATATPTESQKPSPRRKLSDNTRG